MTTTTLAPYLKSKFFDNNGIPLASGTVSTFIAGTSTPTATYTDSTGGTPNANPIVLNARGECDIWLLPNTGYKFVLKDSLGNTIWTEDNVVNSQALTLFATDSGAANAYILTFSTPFTGYTQGEIIYFIPSQSNTGASTVNVNGLGVVPIVNANGSALGANQILAGIITGIIYISGSFQLLSSGSLQGVTTGTFGSEVPLSSAATTDLGSVPAHVALITGTTTITSFGSSANTLAPIYIMRFGSSLTLTYNSNSLILPGNTSIVTMTGDAAIAQYLGNGNWKVLFYQSVGGQQNSKIKGSDTTRTSTAVLAADPDLQSNTLAIGRYSFELYLIFDSVAAGAGFQWTNGGTAIDSRGIAPAVATGFINGAAYGPKSETPYGTTLTYASVSTGTDSNVVFYKGSLLVGTPGTFGVNWAQAVSTASATNLRAGSYMTLTLLNTGNSLTQIQRFYVTAGPVTETIPVGFNNLSVEAWGGAGGGGGNFAGGANGSGGGGGGSGGYCRTTISVTGQGGNTMSCTVGAGGIPAGNGGNTTVASGTFTITTMTAGGGNFGGNAASLGSAGVGGVGGTATGGTVTNTVGNTGAAGVNNVGGGAGGAGAFGIPGITDGGNKAGNGGSGVGITPGTAGGAGIISFTYT